MPWKCAESSTRYRRGGTSTSWPTTRGGTAEHSPYQLTPDGRRVAVLFTKTYGRVLTPGLAACDLAVPDEIAQRDPLAVAWRRLDRELDRFIDRQQVAAART